MKAFFSMGDFLTSLTGGLLGAATAGAAVWALLRDLLIKRVDQQLHALSTLTTAHLELNKQAARNNLDQELSIYPALSELLYRGKIGADAVRRPKTIADLFSGDLHEVSRELTTKLLNYRIYLDEAVFADVHKYKRALQDLVAIIDISTRPDKDSRFETPIKREVSAQVDEICDRIEQLCNSLIPTLRSRMNRLGGELIRTE
jgi:hypothetical protein